MHPVSQRRETHGEYGHLVSEIHRHISTNDGLKLRSNLGYGLPIAHLSRHHNDNSH